METHRSPNEQHGIYVPAMFDYQQLSHGKTVAIPWNLTMQKSHLAKGRLETGGT